MQTVIFWNWLESLKSDKCNYSHIWLKPSEWKICAFGHYSPIQQKLRMKIHTNNIDKWRKRYYNSNICSFLFVYASIWSNEKNLQTATHSRCHEATPSYIIPYKPATYISPYPRVTITTKDMRLAGIPRVRKWRTWRYRWPVCGTSVMIAAKRNS